MSVVALYVFLCFQCMYQIKLDVVLCCVVLQVWCSVILHLLPCIADSIFSRSSCSSFQMYESCVFCCVALVCVAGSVSSNLCVALCLRFPTK